MELDGPELRRVAEAARDLGVFVFLGVTERGRGARAGHCLLRAGRDRPAARHRRCAQEAEPDAQRADGEEVHVAALSGSAAQTGDIARFIALGGRVFVVLASGLISADAVPEEFPFHQLIRDKPEGFYNGGSCIAAPDGSWVVEPRVGEEALVVADLDPGRVATARHSFDPAGHYGRPDVFAVTVDRRRQQAATFTD